MECNHMWEQSPKCPFTGYSYNICKICEETVAVIREDYPGVVHNIYPDGIRLPENMMRTQW